MKKITTLILVLAFSSIFNNKIYANTFYSPSGNKVECHENYTLVTNEKTNLYEFYLDYLGDWGITVNNKKELKNIETTCKELGEYKVEDIGIQETSIYCGDDSFNYYVVLDKETYAAVFKLNDKRQWCIDNNIHMYI